ncbi:MAG TPA: DUF1569 domain-containing protein [Mucilaginibacter sp.]
MKIIFDKTTRDELVARINTLDENSKAQWGKMNIYQMLKHCTLAEEMYLGKKKYSRVFLGRIIGQMALRNLLKYERPMGRNAPTSSHFIVSENNGDIVAERKKWIALLEEYGHFSNPELVHWFFGKMTKEQIGYFVYKHTDHHLRQFNS